MSSESDDDFQSADEGSEDEEQSDSGNINDSSTQISENLTSLELDNAAQHFSSVSKLSEKYGSDSQILLDGSNEVSVEKITEKCKSVDSQILIPKNKTSTCFESSAGTAKLDKIDNDHSVELLNEDNCNLPCNISSVELPVEEFSISGPELNTIPSNSSLQVENLIEPVLDNLKESEKIDSEIGKTKPEKKLKESKIGMKKPREKLGERLGARKLGSRATKPLHGISYKSISTENSLSSNLGVTQVRAPGPDKEYETKIMSGINKNENIVHESRDGGDAWNSWGDWGTSLISVASNLSREVTRGVGSVVETVESGLGIPSAEDYAREVVENEKKFEMEDAPSEQNTECEKSEILNEGGSNFGFGFSSLASIVTDVSGVFETASNKVLIGGLDTLELIGRKTMDVLKENDPGLKGLKRKTNFLAHKNENLSTILQEAKLRAMETEGASTAPDSKALAEYEIYIDPLWAGSEWCPHYEALSLLAKQSLGSIKSLLKSFGAFQQDAIQAKMKEIKHFCEIEEQDHNVDVGKQFLELDGIGNISFEKIKSSCSDLENRVEEICTRLQDVEIDLSYSDCQIKLYKGIIPFIGNSIALMHRSSQLFLISGEDENWVDIAENFNRVCWLVSLSLEKFADDLCGCLAKYATKEDDPTVSKTVTNIYLQVAEANELLQQSLENFIIVLQHLLVKNEADM